MTVKIALKKSQVKDTKTCKKFINKPEENRLVCLKLWLREWERSGEARVQLSTRYELQWSSATYLRTSREVRRGLWGFDWEEEEHRRSFTGQKDTGDGEIPFWSTSNRLFSLSPKEKATIRVRRALSFFPLLYFFFLFIYFFNN